MQYSKVNVLDEKFEKKEPVVKMYRGSSEIANNQGTVVGGSLNGVTKIQFNVPLTPANFLDRAPLLKTTWSLDVPFTNDIVAGAGTLIAANAKVVALGQDVTMSAYPFTTNCVGNADVYLNGAQICTYDMSKYAKILLRLADVEKNMNKNTCPSCPELTFAQISDAQLTMSNPQASFNDATNNYIPNGSWAFDSITCPSTDAGGAAITLSGGLAPRGGIAAAASVVYTFTATTYEPLVVPPFDFKGGKDDETAIFAANNLQLNLTLNNQTAFRAFRCQLISLLNVVTGGNGSNVVIGAPTNLRVASCILKYQTMAEPNLPGFRLPTPYSIFHSWDFYSTFLQSNTAFPAADATGTSTVSNITLSNVIAKGMPSLILVWCDKMDSNYAQNQCKYFYPITNLQISLGTKQGMLANYDIADLYRLSKDCGLNQSYLSFIGKAYANSFTLAGAATQSQVPLVGGVICLRPGVSLPLPSQISTNANGSFTFGFQATCNNYVASDNTGGASPQNPYINIMFIYDSWITIDTSNLRCTKHIGMLTPAEIAGIHQKDEVVVDSDVGPAAGEAGGLLHHSMGHAGYSAPNKLSKMIRKRA